jgi:hypothetical protein
MTPNVCVRACVCVCGGGGVLCVCVCVCAYVHVQTHICWGHAGGGGLSSSKVIAYSELVY